MDLAGLQATLRQFAAERDWQPFHTPKNLAMALMVETAELLEIFQWMTPEQSLGVRGDPVVQQHIGDELAAVLLYLLQLADHSDVDLKRAVGRKLVKNAQKYPPLRPGQPAGAQQALDGATHVLLDYENVQPNEADVRSMVPAVTDVWLFHGPHQKEAGRHFVSFGERLTLIPIAKPGKNALDFHLSFYMGYIAARQPDAHFVILSNDQGYGPILAHAAELGFGARLQGYAVKKHAVVQKVDAAASVTGARAAAQPVAAKKAAPAKAAAKTAPAKKAVAKKAVTKKAAAKKAVAQKSMIKQKNLRTKPAATPPAIGSPQVDAVPLVAKIADSLRKHPNNRPKRIAALQRLVATHLGNQPGKAMLQSVVDRLVQQGVPAIAESGAVSYPF